MTKKIERNAHFEQDPLYPCFTHYKKEDVNCERCLIEESCIIRKMDGW